MAVDQLIQALNSTDPKLMYQGLADFFGISMGAFYFILALVGIWTLVWKGLAMWKSSKKNQMIWFVVFLVINTVGILEILYIFWLSKIKFRGKEEKSSTKKKR